MADKPKIQGKFKQFMSKLKFKFKAIGMKILDKTRKLFKWILTFDIDFIFVFAASFILTIHYLWWARLLFSIGLVYIYKLIIKDIIRIKMIVRGK